MDFSVGNIVKMRKPHPCGSYMWEILRIGADFKIRCTKCGRLVMLSRQKFEKGIKEVVEKKEGS